MQYYKQKKYKYYKLLSISGGVNMVGFVKFGYDDDDEGDDDDDDDDDDE